MNLQEVVVNETNITVSRGEKATLKWLLVKGGGYKEISAVAMYLVNTTNGSVLLFPKLFQSPTKDAIELFDNRLSNARLTGVDAEHSKGEYEINITDVQYGDQGIFDVRAVFDRTLNDRSLQSAAITLNVTGSFLIFVDLFF